MSMLLKLSASAISVLCWIGAWAICTGHHATPTVEISPMETSPLMGWYLPAVALTLATFLTVSAFYIATDVENANELAFKLGFENRFVPRWLRRTLVGTHLHYAYVVGRACRRRMGHQLFQRYGHRQVRV